MSSNQAKVVLRYIRKMSGADKASQLPDLELLARFTTRRDGVAFAGLLRRHGPMVLSLCWRILQNEQDAEDAFQATFLVLGRKAGSLRPQESLAGWLYTVAYRIAQKARIAAARRRKHEGRTATPEATDLLAQITLREAYELLDRELARLPDKFRVPLVLCYLEGRTRDEAAHQLGLAPGLVKSRLEQARERLRVRLVSQGLALSGALVASLFHEATASAAVPTILLDSTAKAATLIAAGGPLAPVVSAGVIAMTEGVLRAMFRTKLKVIAACLLGFGLVGAGASVLAPGATADKPASSPQEKSQNLAGNLADAPKAVAGNPQAPRLAELQGKVLQTDGAPAVGATVWGAAVFFSPPFECKRPLTARESFG